MEEGLKWIAPSPKRRGESSLLLVSCSFCATPHISLIFFHASLSRLHRYFLWNVLYYRLHSSSFFNDFLRLCVVSNQNQLWATITLFHPSSSLFLIDQVVHTVYSVIDFTLLHINKMKDVQRIINEKILTLKYNSQFTMWGPLQATRPINQILRFGTYVPLADVSELYCTVGMNWSWGDNNDPKW
jgi:hypothetical protein